MSNLGLYQWFTTMSKKVGGPLQLLGITAISGYFVVRIMEAGGKCIYKLIKKKSNGVSEKFKVKVEGISNEGIHFLIGDEFYVLEVDDDAVLIDKIDDAKSPYFISKDFLDQILGKRIAPNK